MNRWSRSRRELLARLGLGAACLPLLHATRPLRAAPAFPRRVIIVLQTNGLPAGVWGRIPATTNLANTPLPDPFTPLERFRSELVMLPDLSNPGYQGAGHGAYGTIFSPGPNNPAPEYWTPQVPTLDQICGEAAAKAAAPATLTMNTLPLQVLGDGNERRLGAYRCFFRGNNQPITPELSPWSAADRLFAGRSPGDASAARLRANRRSVLDGVAADLGRFAQSVGTEDRQAIEGHLQAVREVERQLAAGPNAAGTCAAPALGPTGMPAGTPYPTVLNLHLDLVVAALRCDVTRVATVQLGNAYADNVMLPWLGITGPALDQALNGESRDWHDLAHREVRNGVNEKVLLDKWFMTQFAGLLDRLQKIPEGDGTMLTNSVVLWANHMETGANHNAQKIPWLLAGRAGGYFKTGQVIKGAGGQISRVRVMCEIANAMGAGVPYLGKPETGGPLPELRAAG